MRLPAGAVVDVAVQYPRRRGQLRRVRRPSSSALTRTASDSRVATCRGEACTSGVRSRSPTADTARSAVSGGARVGAGRRRGGGAGPAQLAGERARLAGHGGPRAARVRAGVPVARASSAGASAQGLRGGCLRGRRRRRRSQSRRFWRCFWQQPEHDVHQGDRAAGEDREQHGEQADEQRVDADSFRDAGADTAEHAVGPAADESGGAIGGLAPIIPPAPAAAQRTNVPASGRSAGARYRPAAPVGPAITTAMTGRGDVAVA
jgi:hypothetical protein